MKLFIQISDNTFALTKVYLTDVIYQTLEKSLAYMCVYQKYILASRRTSRIVI